MIFNLVLDFTLKNYSETLMKAQGRREETLCSIFNDSSDFKLCGTIYVMKCNMQCKCKINNKLSRKIWEIKPSMVAFSQNSSKVTLMNFIDIAWGNNKQKQPPVAESCNFIKRRLWHRCFAMKFAKLLRTSLLQNIYGWVLLNKNNDQHPWLVFYCL